MMDKLRKLKEMKKEGSSMRPQERDVKMGILKNIMGEADKELGAGLRGMKKVSVASPSKEGLQKGLQKAEEIVSGDGNDPLIRNPDEKADMVMEKAPHLGYENDEAGCSPEEMEMSADELDVKIQALMKLKEEKLSDSQGE